LTQRYEPAAHDFEAPLDSGDAAKSRELKYRRILASAVEVIAEKGFASSRVSDIASRAGVADGTIYLYFKSKDQILMAALDDAFTSFIRMAHERLSVIGDAEGKLRALVRLHLEVLGRNKPLAVVLQTELRQSAKFLAEFSQRRLRSYLELMRDIIREGQESGEFRGTLSDRIAVSCLFGALDDVVTAWILSERDYELAPLADSISDVLLFGVSNGRAS